MITYFSDNLAFHLRRDVTQGISRTIRALKKNLVLKCGTKCPECQLIFGQVVLPPEHYYLSKTGFTILRRHVYLSSIRFSMVEIQSFTMKLI